MPVCGERADEVVGIVMVKELLWQYSVLGAQTDLAALVRPALTFLPKTKLPTMLELFRKSRNHLAVVVDTEDRMLGIVSFEDVLEELVGDIRDEFDIEKGPFYELRENAVLVDAGLPVRDLANETGWPPADPDDADGAPVGRREVRPRPREAGAGRRRRVPDHRGGTSASRACAASASFGLTKSRGRGKKGRARAPSSILQVRNRP